MSHAGWGEAPRGSSAAAPLPGPAGTVSPWSVAQRRGAGLRSGVFGFLVRLVIFCSLVVLVFFSLCRPANTPSGGRLLPPSLGLGCKPLCSGGGSRFH